MNDEQTELDHQREAWSKEQWPPGISITEVFRLNAGLVGLFPMTPEERQQRASEMVGEECVL
jgi:hypothetical protein